MPMTNALFCTHDFYSAQFLMHYLHFSISLPFHNFQMSSQSSLLQHGGFGFVFSFPSLCIFPIVTLLSLVGQVNYKREFFLLSKSNVYLGVSHALVPTGAGLGDFQMIARGPSNPNNSMILWNPDIFKEEKPNIKVSANFPRKTAQTR